MTAPDKRAEPVPTEHLRDQVFAALGYAFAIAALVAGLLSPHLGRLGEAAGILLGVVLVPVNIGVIRGCARLRRSDRHDRHDRRDCRDCREDQASTSLPSPAQRV